MMAAPDSRLLSLPRVVYANSAFRTVVQSVDPGSKFDDAVGGREFVLSIRNLCNTEQSTSSPNGAELAVGREGAGNFCTDVDETDPFFVSNIDTAAFLERPICCALSTDRGDGTYMLETTIPKQGRFTAVVQSLESGGLLGQYWDNTLFTGIPVYEAQQPINFRWFAEEVGDSLGAAGGVGGAAESDVSERSKPPLRAGSDFVAVRWTGYLRPQYSQEYMFFLEVDDTAKLFVDDILVIDKRADAAATFQGRAKLVGQRMTPIVLEYREVRANATCILQYSSQSQRKTVIPGNRLFKAVHIEGTPTFLDVVEAAGVAAETSLVFGDVIEKQTAMAGLSNLLFIQARDADGRNRTGLRSLVLEQSPRTGCILLKSLCKSLWEDGGWLMWEGRRGKRLLGHLWGAREQKFVILEEYSSERGLFFSCKGHGGSTIPSR